MNYDIEKGKIIVHDLESFDIRHILECGQVFRYKKLGTNCYEVYTLNHKATLTRQKTYVEILCDDEKYFVKYLDLDTNYDKIKLVLYEDDMIRDSIDYGKGIRILKQDVLETIISFIISANNNIPNIRRTIERICTDYGKNMGDYFAFPTLDELKKIPREYFRQIKCGYRADYLANTIAMIGDTFDLEELQRLDTKTARERLLTLSGVGPKVAECVLLFGLGKTDVFPTDTWIKKVYCDTYGDTKMSAVAISRAFVAKYGNLSGYAQQYLFYGKRENFGGRKKDE